MKQFELKQKFDKQFKLRYNATSAADAGYRLENWISNAYHLSSEITEYDEGLTNPRFTKMNIHIRRGLEATLGLRMT